MKKMLRSLIAAVTLMTALTLPAEAGSVAVAVASNFYAPLQGLAAGFEKSTGDKVVVSSGSTGKLYAQITAGAPFDLFFAADEERPARLEREGQMVAGSRFTYALGRLVAVSATPGLAEREAIIKGEGRIAMADPKVAPYGRAAAQVLERIIDGDYEFRLVYAENVSQALHFAATGAASVSFVARSQLHGEGGAVFPSAWEVPEKLYDPIVQSAGLLIHGKGNAVADRFLAYVRSDEGRGIIESFGYRLP